MKPRITPQMGCLAVLLLFVLLGVFVEYFGHPELATPGDTEGGGPIAAIGIIGLILFFVIFGAIGLVRAIANYIRPNSNTAPVEPPPQPQSDNKLGP